MTRSARLRRLGAGLALGTMAIVASRGEAAEARIMPLGDSITDGANLPGGYRIELWRRLVGQDRLVVNFVGSLRNGPSGLGDRDHEGHSGWRIDELAASVDGWLARHQPAIVLLMIGTNDLLQNHRVADAPARLGALVDRITARLPQVRVLVATLPPLGEPARQERVRVFNHAVRRLVEARARAGNPVGLVNVARELTPADLADGVHPNEAGYAKIAAAWYAALRPLLSAPR